MEALINTDRVKRSYTAQARRQGFALDCYNVTMDGGGQITVHYQGSAIEHARLLREHKSARLDLQAKRQAYRVNNGVIVAAGYLIG